MTSDFPHGTRRHLTADGLVLLQVARNGEYVTYSDGDGRTVTTRDDDPNSWDARCPDCDGSGEVDRSCPGECTYDQHMSCPSCDGAGTVDTPPPALIGVGSVLAIPAKGGGEAEVIVVGERGDDPLVWPLTFKWGNPYPLGWDRVVRVVRAVPPVEEHHD